MRGIVDFPLPLSVSPKGERELWGGIGVYQWDRGSGVSIRGLDTGKEQERPTRPPVRRLHLDRLDATLDLRAFSTCLSSLVMDRDNQ